MCAPAEAAGGARRGRMPCAAATRSHAVRRGWRSARLWLSMALLMCCSVRAGAFSHAPPSWGRLPLRPAHDAASQLGTRRQGASGSLCMCDDTDLRDLTKHVLRPGPSTFRPPPSGVCIAYNRGLSHAPCLALGFFRGRQSLKRHP